MGWGEGLGRRYGPENQRAALEPSLAISRLGDSLERGGERGVFPVADQDVRRLVDRSVEPGQQDLQLSLGSLLPVPRGAMGLQVFGQTKGIVVLGLATRHGHDLTVANVKPQALVDLVEEHDGMNVGGK